MATQWQLVKRGRWGSSESHFSPNQFLVPVTETMLVKTDATMDYGRKNRRIVSTWHQRLIDSVGLVLTRRPLKICFLKERTLKCVYQLLNWKTKIKFLAQGYYECCTCMAMAMQDLLFPSWETGRANQAYNALACPLYFRHSARLLLKKNFNSLARPAGYVRIHVCGYVSTSS